MGQSRAGRALGGALSGAGGLLSELATRRMGESHAEKLQDARFEEARQRDIRQNQEALNVAELGVSGRSDVNAQTRAADFLKSYQSGAITETQYNQARSMLGLNPISGEGTPLPQLVSQALGRADTSPGDTTMEGIIAEMKAAGGSLNELNTGIAGGVGPPLIFEDSIQNALSIPEARTQQGIDRIDPTFRNFITETPEGPPSDSDLSSGMQRGALFNARGEQIGDSRQTALTSSQKADEAGATAGAQEIAKLEEKLKFNTENLDLILANEAEIEEQRLRIELDSEDAKAARDRGRELRIVVKDAGQDLNELQRLWNKAAPKIRELEFSPEFTRQAHNREGILALLQNRESVDPDINRFMDFRASIGSKFARLNGQVGALSDRDVTDAIGPLVDLEDANTPGAADDKFMRMYAGLASMGTLAALDPFNLDPQELKSAIEGIIEDSISKFNVDVPALGVGGGGGTEADMLDVLIGSSSLTDQKGSVPSESGDQSALRDGRSAQQPPDQSNRPQSDAPADEPTTASDPLINISEQDAGIMREGLRRLSDTGDSSIVIEGLKRLLGGGDR